MLHYYDENSYTILIPSHLLYVYLLFLQHDVVYRELQPLHRLHQLSVHPISTSQHWHLLKQKQQQQRPRPRSLLSKLKRSRQPLRTSSKMTLQNARTERRWRVHLSGLRGTVQGRTVRLMVDQGGAMGLEWDIRLKPSLERMLDWKWREMLLSLLRLVS